MKNKKVYIVFSILIVIFALSVVNKKFQNDIFFTIPIGNDILQNGIISEEHFAWHEGLQFTNSRWAFDCVMAVIYNIANFDGIYIFTLIMTCIIGISLFNILIYKKNNVIISFIITIIALFFAREGFTARAQIVSYFLFVLEVFGIELLLEKNKKRYGLFLLVISILLANFHTSVWPMYFILFMPYFAEYIYCRLKIKLSQKMYGEKINIKLLLIVFIISIFSGLCTPIGLAPYTDMIKVVSGNSMGAINELKSVYIIENLGMIFILGCFMILISLNNLKIKVSDFCMIIGLYIMGLMAVRNTVFLYLIGANSFARMLTNICNPMDLENITDKLNNKNLYISIICFIIIVFSIDIYMGNIGKNYINKTEMPVDATNYILSNINIDDMRIFNHFNFGSYLEFNNIPVFIDSRSGIYCEEFNDTSVMKDWSDCAIYGTKNYKKVFDQYGITHALLYKKELINQYICDDEDYNLIYEDDYFSLYEKVK